MKGPGIEETFSYLGNKCKQKPNCETTFIMFEIKS